MNPAHPCKLDFIADWGLEAEPIYVTDLDRCLPSDALTARPSRGRWRTMPFETQDFSGTLIAAGTETEAADVTYPLDVQGWHAVSIGLHVHPATRFIGRSAPEDTTTSPWA